MAEDLPKTLLRLQQAKERAQLAEQTLSRIMVERDRITAERDRITAERDRIRDEIRSTTLAEYLNACHNLVFTRLTVKTNASRNAAGSIYAYHKLVPGQLKKWTKFIKYQEKMLDKVYSLLKPDNRLFDSRHYLATVGKKVLAAPIANEKMLEKFMHNCVESPVIHIIGELSKTAKFPKLGSGINFENHLKAISDMAPEVIERRQKQRIQQKEPASLSQERPRTPEHIQDSARLNANQICVNVCYNENGKEKRILIAVAEYKSPHKLSLEQLRAGLHDMDIFKDVVCKDKTPVDPTAKFIHDAEQLTAAAIAQTYHYMIKGGLSYSLLTTGQAIVFLRIKWKNPSVLYYHFAEPGLEVKGNEGLLSYTAVAQYVAFHLMAVCDHKSVNQKTRQQAINNLKTWSVNFRDIASTILKDTLPSTPLSPAFHPLSYERTGPMVRRSRRITNLSPSEITPPLGHPQDNEDAEAVEVSGSEDDTEFDEDVEPDENSSPNEHSSSDDEYGPADAGGRHPSSHSPTDRRQTHQGQRGHRGHGANQKPSGTGSRGSGRVRKRKADPVFQYCTQKCLLGLVRGYVLDSKCPNFVLHNQEVSMQSDNDSKHAHPITYSDFLAMLSKQLQHDLDSGITSLDIVGTRGALFKITLLSYGYTFIGKGTVDVFVPDLEHEATVYKRLERLQGVNVPVFLGTLDLHALGRTYYYDFRVDVVYILLLSYGGIPVRGVCNEDRHNPPLLQTATQSMKAIHQEGVVHMDARSRNMLFNAETQGVMFIDFERSQLRPQTQRDLTSLSPTKRRRVQASASKADLVFHPIHGDSQLDVGFANDLLEVDRVFACY
ncbi:hypothetical protein E4U21_007632 [Claviceps maximensis]|nr:hypothetical protein E4U21_007632 [Claviceps maximensis]